MTLDIIIPHYKEPWETCKYLFDTIATQRGIDFKDIRALVVNDGDCLLSESAFCDYPYKVEYLVKEHGGVSDTRNYGLDHSDADYVMFCDIDDGFLNNYALHLLFSTMQEGYDFIISNFVEETKINDASLTLARHDNDMTFMHGKVYRRAFLVDNNCRFDPAMTLHEDGYFNMLVYAEACHHGKQKNLETPIYIWRWNENSVVRKDRDDFVLRTYGHVMQTRIGICRELKKRGYENDYSSAVGMTVLNSYYDFNKTAYYLAKNEKPLREAERAFKAFWMEFKPAFMDLTNQQIADMARVARDHACKHGFLFERMDLRSFLNHIENEVK